MTPNQIADAANRLLTAYDQAATIELLTASIPQFSVSTAYSVLREIDRRRRSDGWVPAGRKIGFTNRTIWERYGVDRPMWAHMYTRTIVRAPDGRAEVSLDKFIQPRIEPEVVFGLRGPIPTNGSAREILEAVEWIAAGFEVVQCHYADWKFTIADCTASFGLHGCLVAGPVTVLDGAGRDRCAAALPAFEATLQRGSEVVARGRGEHVLDSPALALQYLARVLAEQPEAPPLAPGEIITTGTITDAFPVTPGSRWRSDYGALGIPGIELVFR